MNLDDFDKLLEYRGSSVDNKRTITLDDLSCQMLDHLSRNRSGAIKQAVTSYYYTQYLLLKISCTINNRILYVMEKQTNYYKSNYLIKFINSDSRLQSDITNHGIGSIDIKVCGLFNTPIECIDYRDYLMNKSLNNGSVLYNDEIYNGVVPRVLSVILDNNLFIDLANYCNYKKKSINYTILKIIRYLLKVHNG